MTTIYACVYPTGYTLTTAEQTLYGSRAYTSLSACLTAEVIDLTTNTTMFYIDIIGGTAWDGVTDSTQATVTSTWNGTSDYHLEITALGDAAIAIDRSAGYYVSASSNYSTAIQIVSPYTVVTGLGATNTSTTGYGAFGDHCGNNTFVNCVGFDSAAGTVNHGFYFESSSSGDVTVCVNCIALNNGGCGFRSYSTAFTLYLYNCVAINNDSYGMNMRYGSGIGYFTNCYSGNNSYDYVSESCTITLTTSYSSDGTLSTSTVTCAVGSGTYFTNVTAGSEDVTITSADSGLYGVGTDLSSDSVYPVTTDFLGTTRASTPCIGAYEYVSSGTNYNVSLSESLSLSTSDSQLANMPVSISEFLATSDLISRSTAMLASISENLSFSDSISQLANFILSISENLGMSDLISETASMLASITEDMSFSDIYSTIQNYAVSISENMSFTDVMAIVTAAILYKRIKGEAKIQNKISGEISGLQGYQI